MSTPWASYIVLCNGVPSKASWSDRSFVRSRYNPRFGAEKFASTKRTFFSKLLTRDVATSSARVVFPTPPFIDTNAITLDIFYLYYNIYVMIYKCYFGGSISAVYT
jgi:hypothetical protein